MVNNKQQHWVPASYLKAWVDAETRPRQKPYVQVFDRDGGNHRRKSPENIFKTPNLYTIWDDTGRNLRIEQEFKHWEDDFLRVRKSIEANGRCTDEDAADLYCFAGALAARPPHRIEFVKNQWASIAKKMRSIQINPDVAYPPTLSNGPSMDPVQVQELADNPMGTWFPEAIAGWINTISDLFGFEVLVNDTEHPFLTSDTPVVIWHPPVANGRPFPRGLGSPTCEITLPLSPRFALLFRHRKTKVAEFTRVTWERVFEINFRTITRARCNIISDRPDIFFVLAITQHVAGREAS